MSRGSLSAQAAAFMSRLLPAGTAETAGKAGPRALSGLWHSHSSGYDPFSAFSTMSARWISKSLSPVAEIRQSLGPFPVEKNIRNGPQRISGGGNRFNTVDDMCRPSLIAYRVRSHLIPIIHVFFSFLSKILTRQPAAALLPFPGLSPCPARVCAPPPVGLPPLRPACFPTGDTGDPRLRLSIAYPVERRNWDCFIFSAKSRERAGKRRATRSTD